MKNVVLGADKHCCNNRTAGVVVVVIVESVVGFVDSKSNKIDRMRVGFESERGHIVVMRRNLGHNTEFAVAVDVLETVVGVVEAVAFGLLGEMTNPFLLMYFFTQLSFLKIRGIMGVRLSRFGEMETANE